VRAEVVIVVKKEREERGAMVTRAIRASVSPLSSDGLDEALGLSIGLRAIGSGKEMAEAEVLAGGGEVVRAVGRAAVGEDAADGDAMGGIEVDCAVQGAEDTWDLFIGQKRSESQAAVVVDGDVEGFDAGARVASGAVAGGADARTREAAELLDVEVKEFAGNSALVALDGRLGRIESRETMEPVAAQDARESSRGNGKKSEDLSVRTALAAHAEDAGLELLAGLARLAERDRGAVEKAGRKAGIASAAQPAADGALADVIDSGGSAEGELFRS
jgi:hypothetical protein